MKERLSVRPCPCDTCPYRRDAPSGIWHETEYAKLTTFSPADPDTGLPNLGIFLCHQPSGVKTLCRGWLTVEQDSLAVRLLLIQKRVTPADVFRPARVPLYATGAEAAAAGLKDVREPGGMALAAVARLTKKRARCEMTLEDLMRLRADLRQAIRQLTTTTDGRANAPALTEALKKLQEASFWISHYLDGP
jgi:hypothetical protein